MKKRQRPRTLPKLLPMPSPVGNPQLQAIVAKMRAEMPMLIEHVALSAQLSRVKYKALIEEGFTEAQALELCKGGF